VLEYPSGAILALDDLLIDIKVGNTADDPIVARLSQTGKYEINCIVRTV